MNRKFKDFEDSAVIAPSCGCPIFFSSHAATALISHKFYGENRIEDDDLRLDSKIYVPSPNNSDLLGIFKKRKGLFIFIK